MSRQSNPSKGRFNKTFSQLRRNPDRRSPSHSARFCLGARSLRSLALLALPVRLAFRRRVLQGGYLQLAILLLLFIGSRNGQALVGLAGGPIQQRDRIVEQVFIGAYA